MSSHHHDDTTPPPNDAVEAILPLMPVVLPVVAPVVLPLLLSLVVVTGSVELPVPVGAAVVPVSVPGAVLELVVLEVVLVSPPLSPQAGRRSRAGSRKVKRMRRAWPNSGRERTGPQGAGSIGNSAGGGELRPCGRARVSSRRRP